jgi:DNA-binding response OmpR family regulator
VRALAGAGFHVISTDTFEAARQHLATSSPIVLVTALKLGEYNGLHLALRARATSPRTAALLMANAADNFVKEAEQAGATYVVEPVDGSELVAAVLRTLFRPDSSLRVVAPFERRQRERRTAAAAFVPDRRATERRRDLATLMHVAASG